MSECRMHFVILHLNIGRRSIYLSKGLHILHMGKFKKKCDQSVTLGVKNKNHARAFFLFQ